MQETKPVGDVIIVMGVSGSGKTTVGELLAERLGIPFHDADDFHSAANIAKMKSGTPLTDDDRRGWLADMAAAIPGWQATDGAVLACSALKEAYRQTLQSQTPRPLKWVFLDGPDKVLYDRLEARKGHYMKAKMLDSQLQTLERPTYGLCVSIEKKPAEAVDEIVAHLTDPALTT